MSKTSVAKKQEQKYDLSLDEAYEVLRNGPFSILSDKALTGLILMFQRIHSGGYHHGYTTGYNEGSAAGRKARQ